MSLEYGCTVWFAGLSGAGKSTLANLIEAELRTRSLRVEVLDGDEVSPTVPRRSALWVAHSSPEVRLRPRRRPP